MKSLLLLAVALTSTSAFAHRGLTPEFPKVQFGSVFIPVNMVCVHEGVHLMSQKPVSVCVEWEGSEADLCSRTEMKTLITPIHFVKKVPKGEGEWQKVHINIPLHYKIPYGHYTEAGLQVVKTKHFSIPGCE